MFFLVGAAAYFASVVSGVAGFGGALAFLPVLVWAHGVRASVPILTVAVLLGNLSRVWFNRRELRLDLVGLFTAGSVPGALLGSWVYVGLPPFWIKKAIGLFLVSVVVAQKLGRPLRVPDRRVFTPLGALSGFLSAIVGGIGPLSSPFFLAYGLEKEVFVGTEAFCAAGMHLTKTLAYGGLGVMGPAELKAGLAYGAVMVLGSYTARRILERLPREAFLKLVEALLLVVGLAMLFG